MNLETAALVAVPLGLPGFLEPCPVGSNLLFVDCVAQHPRAVRVRELGVVLVFQPASGLLEQAKGPERGSSARRRRGADHGKRLQHLLGGQWMDRRLSEGRIRTLTIMQGMSKLRWIGLLLGAFLLLLVALATIPTLARRSHERYEVVASWGREGSGPGEFRAPIGVVLDDSGYVYVTDSGNDRIQKFTGDGDFVAAWGTSGTGPGELRRPMHIALGPGGLLYVAEYLNDRIQIFARDGTPLGMVSEDTITPDGDLDAPGGAALPPGGQELWIPDFYHHRVAVYSRQGRFVRQIGTAGRVLRGRLHYPTDVAFGPDGTLYVADAYNNRIQRFAPDGRLLGVWGGPLGLGIPGPWRGWFRVATGVAVGFEGQVYVADFYNHRVQKFGPGGAFKAEWGAEGPQLGQFDRPTDVAIGPKGRAYVVDFGNNRVQVFARSQ